VLSSQLVGDVHCLLCGVCLAVCAQVVPDLCDVGVVDVWWVWDGLAAVLAC